MDQNRDKIQAAWLSVLVSFAVGFIACSGCVVVRSKELSKPVDSAGTVRLAPTVDSEAYWYYHWILRAHDFDLDVWASNTKNRHQLAFWFYVLPLPDFAYDGDPATGDLWVKVRIKPKVTNVVFDPSRTLYWATNFSSPIPVSTTPVRTTMGYGEPKYGIYHAPPEFGAVSGAIAVATNTVFDLDFKVYDNPARPFVLSVEGLSSGGTNVPIPRIAFKPATIIRPEMILPY